MDLHGDVPHVFVRMDAWTPGSKCCRQCVQLCAEYVLVSLFFFQDRCFNNMIGPLAAAAYEVAIVIAGVECWGGRSGICGC